MMLGKKIRPYLDLQLEDRGVSNKDLEVIFSDILPDLSSNSSTEKHGASWKLSTVLDTAVL